MKWGKQHHVMYSIADFVAKAKDRATCLCIYVIYLYTNMNMNMIFKKDVRLPFSTPKNNRKLSLATKELSSP